MSDLTLRETTDIARRPLTRTEIDLIKSTVCKDASDEELKLFLHVAQKRGLDPLTRQIHAVKRWDASQQQEVMAIQTGIDGYRLVAIRTNEYQGQRGPFWCGPDGEWRDVWLDEAPPFACKVGVMREGYDEPTWSVVRYDAYVQTTREGAPVKRWRDDSSGMLAKCAEAGALRKAFPEDLSGIYCDEEGGAIDMSLKETPTVVQPRALPVENHQKETSADSCASMQCADVILRLTQRSGEKDGKAWTRYTVHTKCDEKYNTFSESLAVKCKELIEVPVVISFDVPDNPNWAPTITGVEPTDEPLEGDDEG